MTTVALCRLFLIVFACLPCFMANKVDYLQPSVLLLLLRYFY